MQKNKPSVETLKLVFGENAKQARKVLYMQHVELSETEAAQELIRRSYHSPKWSDIRLHVLNSLDSGLHGVESIETEKGEFLDYLNAGDMYTPTIIYWRGRYVVQSLGDMIEKLEKRCIRFK